MEIFFICNSHNSFTIDIYHKIDYKKLIYIKYNFFLKLMDEDSNRKSDILTINKVVPVNLEKENNN